MLVSHRFLVPVSLFTVAVLAFGGIFFAKPPSAVADAPRTVIENGHIILDTKIQDGIIDLGLIRAEEIVKLINKDTVNYQFYDFDDVVIKLADPDKYFSPSLPDDPKWRDYEIWDPFAPPGSSFWATRRWPDIQAHEIRNVDEEILFGLGTKSIYQDDLKTIKTDIDFALSDFSGPGNFVFQAYRASYGGKLYFPPEKRVDNFTPGVKQAIGVRASLNPPVTGLANPSSAHSMHFSAEGVYCLGFSVSTTLKGATEPITSQVKTLRVAVGNVPNPETAPCDPASGSDYVPVPRTPKDPMDPANNQLVSWGHADISATMTDKDGFKIGVHWGHKEAPNHDFANTILFIPDAAKIPIPEPTWMHDYSFLAPIATEFWHASRSSSGNGIPYFGYSSEQIQDAWFDRLLSWNLFGVTGIDGGPAPGEFILGAEDQGVAKRKISPVFSTLQGLPQAVQMIPRAWSHLHASWDFTAPGIYCLSMGMSARLPDGTPVSDTGVFTIVVGGGNTLDPKKMQTCEQAGVGLSYGVPKVADPERVQPNGEVIVTVKGGTQKLVPSVQNGELQIHYGAESITGSDRYYDPEAVVFVGFAGSSASKAYGPRTYLTMDTAKLSSAKISGDLDWRITDVRGGTVIVKDNYTSIGGPPIFEPAAGADFYSIWPETRVKSSWNFNKEGVFCVSMEFTGTAADGTLLTPVAKTLTFAIGVDDLSSVIPCVWSGGENQVDDAHPDDSAGSSDEDFGVDVPVDWSVIPLSGRHVLNDGHVDVHSAITGSTHVLTVHDDNTSPATQYEPDAVVFEVPQKVSQPIPSEDDYAFLGNPGDPVWILPQTPEPGIVWPGWNMSTPVVTTTTGVRWKLDGVQGPGKFLLYEIAGFEGVRLHLDSTDPGKQAFEFAEHAHGNWAFTAEGVYCVNLSISPVPEKAGLTRPITLLFGVGDVDIERVSQEHCGKTPIQIAGSEKPTHTPSFDDISLLDDADRGGVRLIPEVFTPGTTSNVFVGDTYAGKWVNVSIQPGNIARDWYRVSSTGYIRLTAPDGMAPGDYRLVVLGKDDALIGWLPLAVADFTPPPILPPAAVNIPDEKNSSAEINLCVSGAMVLSSGHIDLGARVVNGKVETLLKDNSGLWREPANTVLWLKPESALTVPSNYGSIGAPGATVWQIPQTQDPNLIWLGWSTETLNGTNTTGPVSLSLNSVRGPGTVKVYTQNSFGGVQQVVFNNGGSRNVGTGAHAHANWAFSAEGIYRLDFSYTHTGLGGRITTDQETITVAVGNVDPASVASGDGCEPIAASVLLARGGGDRQASGQQATALSAVVSVTNDKGDLLIEQPGELAVIESVTSSTTGILLGALGVLLILSAAGSALVWRRKS